MSIRTKVVKTIDILAMVGQVITSVIFHVGAIAIAALYGGAQ